MSHMMTSLKEQRWVSVVMSVWRSEQRDFGLAEMHNACLTFFCASYCSPGLKCLPCAQ